MKLYIIAIAAGFAAVFSMVFFFSALIINYPRVFICLGIVSILGIAVILWRAMKTLREINDEVQRWEEEEYSG